MKELQSAVIELVGDYFEYIFHQNDVDKPDNVDWVEFKKVIAINENTIVIQYEVAIEDEMFNHKMNVVTTIGKGFIIQLLADLAKKLYQRFVPTTPPDAYENYVDEELGK